MIDTYVQWTDPVITATIDLIVDREPLCSAESELFMMAIHINIRRLARIASADITPPAEIFFARGTPLWTVSR